MSKNIRRRISHAIQTTFRFSSPKSKITSCCSAKKPSDYEYVSYQPKQTSTKNDYIDLSECHSWALSYSKDSGISLDSNENKCQQLQSTKLYSDDSFSLSTFSNLSSIRPNQSEVSHLNVTMQPSTIQCCRCQCHHYIGNTPLFGEKEKSHRQKHLQTKIYPFIF